MPLRPRASSHSTRNKNTTVDVHVKINKKMDPIFAALKASIASLKLILKLDAAVVQEQEGEGSPGAEVLLLTAKNLIKVKDMHKTLLKEVLPHALRNRAEFARRLMAVMKD